MVPGLFHLHVHNLPAFTHATPTHASRLPILFDCSGIHHLLHPANFGCRAPYCESGQLHLLAAHQPPVLTCLEPPLRCNPCRSDLTSASPPASHAGLFLYTFRVQALHPLAGTIAYAQRPPNAIAARPLLLLLPFPHVGDPARRIPPSASLFLLGSLLARRFSSGRRSSFHPRPTQKQLHGPSTKSGIILSKSCADYPNGIYSLAASITSIASRNHQCWRKS